MNMQTKRAPNNIYCCIFPFRVTRALRTLTFNSRLPAALITIEILHLILATTHIVAPIESLAPVQK